MHDLLGILRARQTAQEAIHRFFKSRDYLSLDTPIAVISPGTEVHLGYFSTQWQDFRAKKQTLYLRSSPELHLKQALALGVDRVYHLGKCFRNQGELADWHHPEFTMLEFYQSGIALQDFMSLTTELLIAVADALQTEGFKTVTPKARPLRLSIFEAFSRWAGIELEDGDGELARKGMAQGFTSLRATDDFETAYFKILLDVIEPRLKEQELVFLYDYPVSQCALARIEHHRAQRFELYFQGIELCNAFDELLDTETNRRRIRSSNDLREQLGHGSVPEDEDFFKALSTDIKPCSGNALGFDRLLALLLGESNLDRVIPFRWNQPWLRSVPEAKLF